MTESLLVSEQKKSSTAIKSSIQRTLFLDEFYLIKYNETKVTEQLLVNNTTIAQ